MCEFGLLPLLGFQTVFEGFQLSPQPFDPAERLFARDVPVAGSAATVAETLRAGVGFRAWSGLPGAVELPLTASGSATASLPETATLHAVATTLATLFPIGALAALAIEFRAAAAARADVIEQGGIAGTELSATLAMHAGAAPAVLVAGLALIESQTAPHPIAGTEVMSRAATEAFTGFHARHATIEAPAGGVHAGHAATSAGEIAGSVAGRGALPTVLPLRRPHAVTLTDAAARLRAIRGGTEARALTTHAAPRSHHTHPASHGLASSVCRAPARTHSQPHGLIGRIPGLRHPVGGGRWSIAGIYLGQSGGDKKQSK